MKNILITGGAGFIGAHLSKELLKQNNKIICVDNFITGKKENIKDCLKNPKFKLIEQDISNPLFIDDDIDIIFHLASIASPKDYFKFPIKTLKAGALGTYNCLGLAKVKKAIFILASTSEIYGDPEVHPQTEEYWGHVNAVGPRGCYDESKRFAESMTVAYKNTHNLNTKIIRIFNTYGPYMRKNDGRVMPAFINQALAGKDLTIYGNGNQTRSFCYIDDLIKGIIKISKLKDNVIVNLGNPKEITIKCLAEKILDITKSKSNIKYLPKLKDEPARRKPDVTKARNLINFEPKVSLENGIEKTIDWFKKTRII